MQENTNQHIYSKLQTQEQRIAIWPSNIIEQNIWKYMCPNIVPDIKVLNSNKQQKQHAKRKFRRASFSRIQSLKSFTQTRVSNNGSWFTKTNKNMVIKSHIKDSYFFSYLKSNMFLIFQRKQVCWGTQSVDNPMDPNVKLDIR